jgi:hypothetical protein
LPCEDGTRPDVDREGEWFVAPAHGHGHSFGRVARP